MFKLVIRAGTQAGEVFEFPANQAILRLGRSAANDLVLHDKQASRYHVQISRHEAGFLIRDLESTNGTFVNGKRLTGPRTLQPGDRIRIGGVVVECQMQPVAAGTSEGAGGLGRDWEASLWQDVTVTPDRHRRRLIWGLAASALTLALVVVAAVILALQAPGRGAPAGTGAAVRGGAAETAAAQATGAQATALLAEADQAGPTAPKPGKPLEALPALVVATLPGVQAETLPATLARALDTLTPGQVQGLVAALFPEVEAEVLPRVVAASFPQMQEVDRARLLEMAFPGRETGLPVAGPVAGRLALGIYDPGRKQVDLYLVDLVTARRERLLAQAGDPDLAADGRWLAYRCSVPGKVGLRLMAVGVSGDRLLIAGSRYAFPSLAPDGQRIAYCNRDSGTLHIMGRDGTGRENLGRGEHGAWSPAGDRLVYRGCTAEGKCGLIVAGADGSNRRQITAHAGDAAPRWSPNGGQIAFMSDRDGDWDIYLVNVDGSWLRRITTDPANDTLPVWSPDGLRLAWRSDRAGRWGVWVAAGIGGAAEHLFDADPGPDWTWARLAWAGD